LTPVGAPESCRGFGAERGTARVDYFADLINAYSPVVPVAALTSRKTEKVYPFEVLIEPPEGGMQMRALDKRRIVGRFGTASSTLMERVDAAVRIAVGLTRPHAASSNLTTIRLPRAASAA
jgi:hypothetical protein